MNLNSSWRLTDHRLEFLAMFTKQHIVSKGKGLIGPNGGRVLELRRWRSGGGEDGIGGGLFAKRSMVAKDGLGGDGFIVNGGRSPSTSSKDGDDGGVENKSSMGSRLNSSDEVKRSMLSRSGWGGKSMERSVGFLGMVDGEEKRILDLQTTWPHPNSCVILD
ncbi:hypothetical protein Tco_0343698 [Tanacetum coccineum]